MAESKLVHEEETTVPNHHEVSRKSFPDCFYLQLGNVAKFRIPSCLSKTGGWSSSSINKVLFIWNKGSSISPGHHKDNQQLLFCYITIPCGNPLFCPWDVVLKPWCEQAWDAGHWFCWAINQASKLNPGKTKPLNLPVPGICYRRKGITLNGLYRVQRVNNFNAGLFSSWF